MTHLDRSPLLIPFSREASKQSFTRVSRFAHVLQLIYVRNSSTTHLARSKKKKKNKDFNVPSTLRACAVYRNSSTISRMTVGNGNLSVLDCSLDWQVKGKASTRLVTMQTTLAKLFILYYSFPHLLLTMTMTLKRTPSKACTVLQSSTTHRTGTRQWEFARQVQPIAKWANYDLYTRILLVADVRREEISMGNHKNVAVTKGFTLRGPFENSP